MKILSRKDRNLYYAYVQKPDGGYTKVYAKTKREVRRKYDELTKQILEGHYVDNKNVTFKAWVSSWEQDYTLNLKGSTQKTYKSHIRNYLIPSFGSSKLTKITHNEVQAFVRKIMEKGLSPKTIHNIHLTLHRILRDAQKAGLISENPADKIVLPKVAKNQVDFFDEEGLTLLIEKARELYPDYYDIYEFMVLTGMRVSEVLGLTADRYDKKSQTILIDRQLNSSNYYTLETPKHESVRKIYVSEKVVSIIENRLRLQEENKRVFGKLYSNEEGFIFTRENGEHLTQTMLYKRFKRVVREIGLPNLRLHDLRHAYVTLALESGVDVKQIQESLGHRDASFTLNRYGHATEKMKRDGVTKIGKRFDKLFE